MDVKDNAQEFKLGSEQIEILAATGNGDLLRNLTQQINDTIEKPDLNKMFNEVVSMEVLRERAHDHIQKMNMDFEFKIGKEDLMNLESKRLEPRASEIQPKFNF